MKKIYYFLPLLLVAGFYLSCKKDIGSDKQPDPTVPVLNFDTKEVEVIAPAGSAFKPVGSKVFSFGSEQTVDASGKAKVTFEKGSSTLAYVFNTDKKLVLAGFITDTTNVISPATTAKVLLYLGYNIPLQPDTLSVYFLNKVEQLPAEKQWEKEFETLFLADPLVLSNKNFVVPLKARMTQMTAQIDPIDIRNKVADILVDANDIKSGLQISDDGLSKFTITNNYRRRAYAFLYKMSYKDVNGSTAIVKNKLDQGAKADMETDVSPVSAVSGFLSEIGKSIEGKGLESFSVTSGPFPLELQDNESEALYKLRVVGPGAILKAGLTDAETSKLTRLSFETFLLDLVIPTVGVLTSLPDRPTPGVMPEVDRDLKTDALMSFVKSMPDVYDEIKNGNFKVALKKLLENIYKDATGVLMKELFLIALDKEGPSGGVSTFFNERFENLLAVLSMADAALGASDVIRISSNILSSAVMDEWDIKARSGQVKLLPKSSVVVPFQQKKLTAEIKNLTQTASYEWSTSGKYGKLTDTKGHTDQASFTSSDKDVFYTSKVSSASLSTGDNLEYIYVTAYIGSSKVGTDTAIINVKKDKYTVKPDGITLSGKNGAYNEVKLYLKKPDGTNSIAPNNDFSYKVIWTTAGKYGKLNSNGANSVTTVTAYDNNSVRYECLDKDTKSASETINASIYIKPKSAAESEYKLFDEASGSVKIDNDDKKKILHLGLIELHGDTSYPGHYNCSKTWAVLFPEDKDAKSYQLMFYGANINISPETYTWSAGQPSPSAPFSYVGPGYAGGIYTVTWGQGTWSNGSVEHHVTEPPPSGKAQLTIFLK